VVATKALARFAVAPEGLGIEVAIVDFVDGHARLVKPFSVVTRHVRAGLLDTDCGGGTPLADALGLARQLVEGHRDDPLIVAVTDGEPSSVDDVIDQIRAPMPRLLAHHRHRYPVGTSLDRRFGTR
jgi:Mg-chelatase subunit ChlD